ncbi:MAG: hypothetical protein ACI85H_001321, partial [Paracoccaceae bacterium]
AIFSPKKAKFIPLFKKGAAVKSMIKCNLIFQNFIS